MGALVYYVIYGGIAFALGFLIFWIWDRKQSSPIMAAIREADWLKPVDDPEVTEPLSPQASFDYAASFGAALKGVFAHPTPAKLERLNALLASPHNLEDQLWRDMPGPLRDTHRSYSREYAVLLQTVADHSNHPVQLYAAFRLATCLPGAPSEIADIATRLGTNDAIKDAMRTAADLRKAQA